MKDLQWNVIYYILIPEVMPLMKQNMSSVIVFPEQEGYWKHFWDASIEI